MTKRSVNSLARGVIVIAKAILSQYQNETSFKLDLSLGYGCRTVYLLLYEREPKKNRR